MDGNIVLDFGGWSNPTNIFITPRMHRIPVYNMSYTDANSGTVFCRMCFLYD